MVLPVRLRVRPEPQPRLMNQRRGLQRVTGGYARHLLRRDLPQFGIDQLKQPRGRRIVAGSDGGEDLGDIAHAGGVMRATWFDIKMAMQHLC